MYLWPCLLVKPNLSQPANKLGLLVVSFKTYLCDIYHAGVAILLFILTCNDSSQDLYVMNLTDAGSALPFTN